jgi:hypothetical protein
MQSELSEPNTRVTSTTYFSHVSDSGSSCGASSASLSSDSDDDELELSSLDDELELSSLDDELELSSLDDDEGTTGLASTGEADSSSFPWLDLRKSYIAMMKKLVSVEASDLPCLHHR